MLDTLLLATLRDTIWSNIFIYIHTIEPTTPSYIQDFNIKMFQNDVREKPI